MSLFQKETNTGLYVNFNSFVPWSHGIPWIRSFVARASCFVLQTNYLRKLPLLWNLLRRIIFQNLLWNQLWMSLFTAKNGTNNDNMINNKVYPRIIYFHFQYYSHKRVSLIKSCIRMIKPNCLKDRPVVLKPMYDVTKMEFFCSTKDRTSLLCQSNIAHDFVRLGCSANFFGKTARTFR